MHNINLNRPETDIALLAKIINGDPNKVSINLSSGCVIDSLMTSKPSTILLEFGHFSFHRKYDGLHLFDIDPPFPLGITESVLLIRNYYILCNNTCAISFVSHDDFIIGVENNNAWKSIAKILTYLMDVSEEHLKATLNSTNNYEIIKTCLEKIWSLPEDVRTSTSVFKYIQSRHRISRSSITKIIKTLNDGCYIQTQRGTLVKMKKLPERY